MQLLEEGEVVEDHSGSAQFTSALTDQVHMIYSHKVYPAVCMLLAPLYISGENVD